MKNILKGVFIALMFSTVVTGQVMERSEVPLEETWNLQDLYESDQVWQNAKEQVRSRMDKVKEFKGKLDDSAQDLLACMEFNSQFWREFLRLHSYASRKSDQDTRVSEALAMKQEMNQIMTDYQSMASFIEPEILSMDKQTIQQYIDNEPDLKNYRMYLHDLLRRQKHTLSEKEEKIIAEAGLMADGASSIFSIFSNADLPYPEITLSTGETVLLNASGYVKNRALRNRKDREKVFDAFFGTLDNFRRTFGTQLYANLKKDMFYANVRGYNSTLESALDVNNIPVEVYHNLIKNVRNNLDTFHRYLKLKERMLRVDQLKYSDLYAPVVKGVDLTAGISEAEKMILDAMKPLGDRYTTVLVKAFANRWIDYHPTLGKRSGAYSAGSAYDVHPYILMNYNQQYSDVSTLAHELGHALHSYFSNKTQPFPMADYPIFVAEVASTLNEALLINKQLNEIKDNDIRLSLLMNYLESIRTTVFRQTQFADYELKIHQQAEQGIPMTGDKLTEIYADIVREYYGHDKNICYVDDKYTIEWAYIPHFYYNYYVYQYATSFTASTALAEKILDNESGAAENYIKFISSGGSEYPIDLLKKAGVDMTTNEPFDKTMQAMNRTMDEIEKLLK
jgi:oligoendopeptidase F